MAYQFQSVISAGPFIVDRFAIDYAQLGSLVGLYMLPGILISLPGGMLGQRFGDKRIVVLGLSLMVLGGCLMASESYSIVLVGRLISGVGAVIINVLITKMVADWFAGQEIIAAMALLIASWPSGIALGLLTFPTLVAYGWSAPMLASAVAAALSLVGLILLYRDHPQSPQSLPRLRLDLSPREWGHIIVLGIVWGSYNAGYIILISFLPEQFTQQGYSLVDASRLVSLMGWVLIPAVPIAGILAERISRPVVLMIGTLLITALVVIAFPFTANPISALSALVLVIGLPAGLLMALPAQVLPQSKRSAGMGVFYTCHYGCMAALPVFAGFLRDQSAAPHAPILFVGIMMVAIALTLAAERRLFSRQQFGSAP